MCTTKQSLASKHIDEFKIFSRSVWNMKKRRLDLTSDIETHLMPSFQHFYTMVDAVLFIYSSSVTFNGLPLLSFHILLLLFFHFFGLAYSKRKIIIIIDVVFWKKSKTTVKVHHINCMSERIKNEEKNRTKQNIRKHAANRKYLYLFFVLYLSRYTCIMSAGENNYLKKYIFMCN